LLTRRPIVMPNRPDIAYWLKVIGELGDDPALHACAVTYAADDLPSESSFALHPDRKLMAETGDNDRREFISASLDHSIWFHRYASATDFQLHTSTCQTLSGGRGLNSGDVFAADGSHIATVQQQVLIRKI
jgi:acyl-CoA thioesterase-2